MVSLAEGKKASAFLTEGAITSSTPSSGSSNSLIVCPCEYIESNLNYQACARSALARRACALRAQGLLLAEGTPTVRGGRLFDRSTKFFYGNSCNSGTKSRKIVPKVGN